MLKKSSKMLLVCVMVFQVMMAPLAVIANESYEELDRNEFHSYNEIDSIYDGDFYYEVDVESVEEEYVANVSMGSEVFRTGTIGWGGAPWVLYDDGVMVIGAGITNSSPTVRWLSFELRPLVTEIIFTEPVIANDNLANFFEGFSNLITIRNANYLDTSAVTRMDRMFDGVSSLEDLDISGWNTSNVVNMGQMFRNASSLTNLDIFDWDTSRVTDMNTMFGNASSLTSLDLSKWDTSNVIDMRTMFYGVSSLVSLDVSDWDTGNVTTMWWMFQKASSLTNLDLSQWDTSNVTNMDSMFRDASSLIALDLSNWNTSNVTHMDFMFEGALSLTTLDVSGWDTSRVTLMRFMFQRTPSLTTLDLSSWDTSSVTNMLSMFAGASSLSHITFGSNFVSRFSNSLPNVSVANGGSWRNLQTGATLQSAALWSHLSTYRENSYTWVWNRSINEVTIKNGETDFAFAPAGQVIAIVAISPEEGYEFAGWTSNSNVEFADEFAESTTFVMPSHDVHVVAVFEQLSGLSRISEIFPDENLAEAVALELRFALGFPVDVDSQVSLAELQSITSLSSYGVVDLSGMEYLTSLASLTLHNNQISDLNPLSGLTELRSLVLNCDVSPLPGLIEDISPLSELTQLRMLRLRSNQISDINALSNLTNLWVLDLRDNQISDVSPLSGLIQLESLGLNSNQISDLRPLSSLVNLLSLGAVDQNIQLDLVVVGAGTNIELFFRDGTVPDTWGYGEFTFEDQVLTWHTAGDNSLHWDIFIDHDGHAPFLWFSGTIRQTVTDDIYGQCPVIGQGQFTNQATAQGGVAGSLWRICEDGTLEIDEGFINWTLYNGPWHAHRNDITAIVIEGPVTAGTSLRSLFRDLPYVIEIEGLTHLDTSRTTNMENMFRASNSLVRLDLSSFDTSRVTNMTRMFTNTNALRELTLGSQFSFAGAASLPVIRMTDEYTGMWQNVGEGTVADPRGEFVFTSAQLMSQFDGSMTDTFVWQPIRDDLCPVIVEGRFANQATAQGGLAGAVWRICEDGTLEIESGFINWTLYSGPWHAYRNNITAIVIGGPVTAGSSLRSLFRDLPYVTEIEGLTYLDTSRTTNMENMFRASNSLVRLDLSSFDTSHVTNMTRMFTNTNALRELTLGSQFSFAGAASLPVVRATDTYTGMWQNIGEGSVDNPQGNHILTSAQLMATFDGATMSDTFVWQPVRDDLCPVIVEGRFGNQATAQGGLAGAVWRICEDGTLEIDSGFINWTLYNGPWHAHRNDITAIVIGGPVTAGTSLRSLFRDLTYVTAIEGLTYFDTSRTTSMENMFRTSIGITELDLSSFDSRNVTNMHRMFTNMRALEELRLGNLFAVEDNAGLRDDVDIIIE